MWTEAILDRKRWGGTWNIAQGTSAEAHLPVGILDLEKQFIEPRRVHLYRTHALSAKAPPQGITSAHRAGIPEPQRADILLGLQAVEWQDSKPGSRSLRVTNALDVAVDLSGWQLKGSVRFTFDPGTVLPPLSALDVAEDLRARKAKLPGQFVVGPLKPRDSDKSWVSLRDSLDREAARISTLERNR